MIETDRSGFSILPENLAEQYRQRYQHEETLKTLVFQWQHYSLALPMVAIQRVLPVAPTLQAQLNEESHLNLNGVVVQIITLPTSEGGSHPADQPEPHFILLFTIPDGRLLGFAIAAMPNVVELPLPSFSPIAAMDDQATLPFGNWVKFVAHHIHEEDDLYGSVFYLLDLDRIQIHGLTHASDDSTG
jgi:chemotaxis signal transduction protein